MASRDQGLYAADTLKPLSLSTGEGTFRFKRQWGAEPHEMVWEYWTAEGHSIPDLRPANPKFGLAIKAWQHLPVKVATTLGPFIVRNIP